MKRAIEIDPGHHPSLNYLGYFYAEKGIRLKEAERLLRRALYFQPNQPAYLDSLGWIYYKQGRLKRAKKYLEKAAKKEKDWEIYKHLGDLYLKMGEEERANNYWEKSRKIKKDGNFREN